MKLWVGFLYYEKGKETFQAPGFALAETEEEAIEVLCEEFRQSEYYTEETKWYYGANLTPVDDETIRKVSRSLDQETKREGE